MSPRRYDNYGAIRQCLESRESFDGNSAHGRRVDSDDAFSNGKAWYSVWSYSTLILRYDLQSHTVVYFDGQVYSPTTTRLQNLIRWAFDIERGTMCIGEVPERRFR